MLGRGYWRTSSNDSGGGGSERTRGRGGLKSEAVRGVFRPVDDDDDYNNRAFRGFEITAHAPAAQFTDCFLSDLQSKLALKNGNCSNPNWSLLIAHLGT